MYRTRVAIAVILLSCSVVGISEDSFPGKEREGEGRLKSAHLLRPGDVLEITVYEHPELKLKTRVDADGTIRFPLCGSIPVEGETTGRVSEVLSEKLSAADIERAQVYVFVTKYTPRYVYVLGEVGGASKSFEIPPEGRMTALQVVSAAGGFSERADLRKVFVLRGNLNGEPARIPVDVQGITAFDGKANDVQLQPGDTVIVPPKDKVFVLGEVKNAGAFDIRSGITMTVTRVIAMAGGFSRLAAEDAVLLIRGEEVRRINLRRALRTDGDLSLDLSLEPGDILFVPESRW